MGRISQLNSSTPNIPTPNVEFHEARENNEPNWQTRMHRVAVEIASTFFGQAMMMQFDKLLWTLEKTATWISNAKTGKRQFTPDEQLQVRKRVIENDKRRRKKYCVAMKRNKNHIIFVRRNTDDAPKQ